MKFIIWKNWYWTLKTIDSYNDMYILRGLLRLFVEARMVCTNFFLAEHNAFKNAIHLKLPFWALMDNKSNEWAHATTVNYSFSGCKNREAHYQILWIVRYLSPGGRFFMKYVLFQINTFVIWNDGIEKSSLAIFVTSCWALVLTTLYMWRQCVVGYCYQHS